MSSRLKNYLIVLLFFTTLGGAGLVVRTRRQLADALNAPTLRVTHGDFRSAPAPAPLASSAPRVAAPAPPVDAPVGDTPPDRPDGGQFGGGRGARYATQMAELMKDPAFVAASKIEQEARLDSRYSSLFKELNLPPEKLAALKALLAERESASREVWASAAAQGLNPRDNRDQLRQLTADLQAEVDANIKSTFGDSVSSALAAYNASAPQRSTVGDLAQKLTYSSQPLNDSQAQQLTRILGDTGTPAGRTVLITAATLVQAQGVLTADQITVLKSLQAEQQARQLVAEKTRAAREQAQAPRN